MAEDVDDDADGMSDLDAEEADELGAADPGTSSSSSTARLGKVGGLREWRKLLHRCLFFLACLVVVQLEKAAENGAETATKDLLQAEVDELTRRAEKVRKVLMLSMEERVIKLGRILHDAKSALDEDSVKGPAGWTLVPPKVRNLDRDEIRRQAAELVHSVNLWMDEYQAKREISAELALTELHREYEKDAKDQEEGMKALVSLEQGSTFFVRSFLTSHPFLFFFFLFAAGRMPSSAE
jgi:hypothetical protein